MDQSMYPASTREIAQKRKELAPAQHDAFQAFSKAVFAEGALSAKMKQLIAVAVAHVTQCPYCIRGHTEGRCGAALPTRKSWRRSGSLRRCARAAPTLIQRWQSM